MDENNTQVKQNLEETHISSSSKSIKIENSVSDHPHVAVRTAQPARLDPIQ